MIGIAVPMLIGAIGGIAMSLVAGDLGTPAGLVFGFTIGVSFAIGRVYEKRAAE